MEGVAARQRARVVAGIHRLLADNAGCILLQRGHHEGVGELPLSQGLYRARHSFRLQPHSMQRRCRRRAQRARVVVDVDGTAVTKSAHLQGNVLRRKKHALRCTGVTQRCSSTFCAN